MSGATPDLSQSGGVVNPMMAHFPEETIAAETDFGEKSVEQCVAEDKKLIGVLKKATEQATTDEGTLDFDGLDMWAGDTQEKTYKFIKIHSRLCGVRNVINAKKRAAQEEELKKKQIIEQNTKMPPFMVDENGALAVRLQAGPTNAEAYDAICQEQLGMPLAQALEENRGRTLTLTREHPLSTPAHKFRADTFETDHWDPFITREPGWVPKRTTPLQVYDIVPMFMTGRDAVQWMEEVTYGPAAAETAEGTNVPEANYVLQERSQDVKRIAHHLPVTEESLTDEPQVRGYLDYVMPLGVRQRLDLQIINGTGQSSQLDGVLAYGARAARTVITDALGAGGRTQVKRYGYARVNNNITKPWNVLLQANYLIRDHGMGILGMQMPTHAVLHPNIYLQCLLSESSSGGYYVGGPASPLLGMAWGMDVVQTTHLTDGDSADAADRSMHAIGGIIGDFSPMFIRLYMRHDVRTEFGYQGADFIQYKMTIRSSVRCALAVCRAEAFAVLVNPIAAGTAVTAGLDN